MNRLMHNMQTSHQTQAQTSSTKNTHTTPPHPPLHANIPALHPDRVGKWRHQELTDMNWKELEDAGGEASPPDGLTVDS